MLHLITDTAAFLQQRHLCSGKQTSHSLLYGTAAQNSTIPFRAANM